MDSNCWGITWEQQTWDAWAAAVIISLSCITRQITEFCFRAGWEICKLETWQDIIGQWLFCRKQHLISLSVNSSSPLTISLENSPGAWEKSLVQCTKNTMQAAHKHCKASWTRRTFHHFTHSHVYSRIFSLLLPVTFICYLNVNYQNFQERGEGESVRITIMSCVFWNDVSSKVKKLL